jgi:hypothetical protein
MTSVYRKVRKNCQIRTREESGLVPGNTAPLTRAIADLAQLYAVDSVHFDEVRADGLECHHRAGHRRFRDEK